MSRLLIIDDHPIVAQGCSALLSSGAACEILAADSLLEGFRTWRAARPDIVIVDLSFNQRTLAGLSFIRRIHALSPRDPILAFSMHCDPIIVRRALSAGATGYLNKDAPPREIEHALDRIRAGRRYVASDLAADLALLPETETRDIRNDLTRRERDVLVLLARGRSYRSISAALGISYKTVANICSILKSKLEVDTLPELVVKAIETCRPQRQ